MKHSNRYKRFFASVLLKVAKQNKNVEYTNKRANQLNQIEILVIEKLIPTEKLKTIKTINNQLRNQ